MLILMAHGTYEEYPFAGIFYSQIRPEYNPWYIYPGIPLEDFLWPTL